MQSGAMLALITIRSGKEVMRRTPPGGMDVATIDLYAYVILGPDSI